MGLFAIDNENSKLIPEHFRIGPTGLTDGQWAMFLLFSTRLN